MAETPSTMLPLGTIAPDFKLQDSRNNQWIELQNVKSNIATVIVFICNHCPYVKHVQRKLIDVIKHYQSKEISFIAINSNDAKKYLADSPENMKLQAEQFDFTFPYLFDESQDIAKAYHAACTPDFFVFDHDLKCVYRGRFDDSTPGNNNPVTGKDLCAALDNILAGKSVDPNQMPSVGCNIKWKK